MRFVCTNSNYRTFRGYVFAHGKPTTVTDRASIEALKRHHEFVECEDEVQADPHACPKCGRVVKQGHYMHVKYCKGS